MRYVAVLGAAAPEKITNVTFKYFPNFLVSMAEPTTNKSWTLLQIEKQMKKIVKQKNKYKEIYPEAADKIKLFVDSGGFQVIMGYITKRRVKEYVRTYHYLLKKYKDDIDYIFSLDVMNRGWNKQEQIEFNDYSINQSIQLIKEIPEIADKQLFIVQTRTEPVFDLWKELMDKHDIYQYYTRYSFGGLVGLKKETNAKFSHVIPFIFWLLLKIKLNNGKIEHLHLLGQSSKLMVFTSILIEKLLQFHNLNIDITMDSSELIRFAKIDHKLPILCKKNETYEFVKERKDLYKLLDNHSLKHTIDNLEEKKTLLCDHGKLENDDFVDFMCQNINSMITFSHEFIDNKTEDEIMEFLNKSPQEIKEISPVFNQGRLAQEIYNNNQLIKEFLELYLKKDLIEIENKCIDILKNY